MLSLNLLGRWVESLGYEYRILSHCSRHQSPRSSCMECIEICPVNAIRLEDDKPLIHTKGCIDCGDCVASCPVQAVEGFLPQHTIINNQFIVTDNTDNKIPTVKELLIYYKKGVTSVVCEQKDIHPKWKQTIENANEVLEQLNEEPFQVYQEQTISNEDNTMTRRELFFSWEKDFKRYGKKMLPAKWRFNHESLDLPKYYPDYQFVDLSIDTKKCTLCKACQTLCQKDILRINETHFTISAQECSNCSLCQDICPEGAITLKEMISPVSSVSHPIYTSQCVNCDTMFDTLTEEQDKCFLCIKQEQYLANQSK